MSQTILCELNRYCGERGPGYIGATLAKGSVAELSVLYICKDARWGLVTNQMAYISACLLLHVKGDVWRKFETYLMGHHNTIRKHEKNNRLATPPILLELLSAAVHEAETLEKLSHS